MACSRQLSFPTDFGAVSRLRTSEFTSLVSRSRFFPNQHYRIDQMKGYLIAFALLAGAFGFARTVMFFRARAMRSLALRRGFQFIDRPLPASFRMTCYPADVLKGAFNVIEGQQNRVPILIFDSVIGEGRGRYCTFIATQTDTNLFGNNSSREKIVQSCGWSALYRLRFLQIPGTVSIQRIEDHLNNLRT